MLQIVHPNRWFLWTIAILIASGLGMLFFIFYSSKQFDEQVASAVTIGSENPSDPSYFGWRVFRSDPLGFSVKYPPTWQIEIDSIDGEEVVFENPNNFGENVSIALRDLETESVIRAEINYEYEQQIWIAGEQATWFSDRPEDDLFPDNLVLVPGEKKLYYIAGHARAFEKIVFGINFLEE